MHHGETILNTTAIIGAQWGDEGKGKIVDVLAEKADVVVRYQGGNNAGHTIVREGETFKLHLLPSGLIWGKKSLVGLGVVIDPKVMLIEIESLEKRGIKVKGNLGIDPRAHIIMPWHILLDSAREMAKAESKIGTTCRGIGPAYEDRYSREGIRFEDLIDPEKLAALINKLHPVKNAQLEKLFHVKTLASAEKIIAEYTAYGKKLSLFLNDVSETVHEAIAKKKTIIFEGAQGVLLDCGLGTYPYVTSSHPIAAGIGIGVGIGMQALNRIEGVAKAYTTRVGSGPFPTELLLEPIKDLKYDLARFKERALHKTHDSYIGEYLRRQGFEFGTTTGRPRRTGWLDAVLLRTGVRWNGYTGLHLTKLDVLGGLDKIKLCTHYLVDKKKLDYVPAKSSEFALAEPQYITLNGFEDLGFAGWNEIVEKGKKKGFRALPANAYDYVKLIEKYVSVPIVSVSVGPDRTAIIWRR